MPKASISSTASSRLSQKALAAVRLAATREARAEAASKVETMLRDRLAVIKRMPVAPLPRDHADAALNPLAAAVEVLRQMVDSLETKASAAGDDDWLTAAILSRWEVAVSNLARAPALTVEGLKMKAAAASPSMWTEARIAAGGATPRMDAPRDEMLLSLFRDIADMKIAQHPQHAAISRPRPNVEIEVGEHNGIRVGARVAIRSIGRGGVMPERLGTVRRVYRNPRGYYFAVETDAGEILSIRPAYIRE